MNDNKKTPQLNPALKDKYDLIAKFQKAHIGGFGEVDFSTISEEKANKLCASFLGRYLIAKETAKSNVKDPASKEADKK